MTESSRSDADTAADVTDPDCIRQQKVVAELGQHALETDDIDELMSDVTATVSDVLETSYGAILELEFGGETGVLRDGIGWKDDLVDEASMPVQFTAVTDIEDATDDRQITDGLATDEQVSEPELLTEHDIVSGLEAIIGPTEEPWGILGVYTTETRTFRDRDAHFIQNVATVLGTAIENTQTERRFQAVFDDPNILVSLLEPDGTVVDINETAMGYVDTDHETIVGTPFWETPWWHHGTVHEDNVAARDAVRTWTERAASDEYVSFEITLKQQNGTDEQHQYRGQDRYTISGVFRPVTDDTGEILSIVVSARDVTERRANERRLEMRKRRLSALIDNVPGMVYRCENERGWPMSFVSDACESITGYEPDAIERDEVSWGKDVMFEGDRESLWKTISERAANGESFAETYRIETADGDVRWVREYGQSVFDDEGTLLDIEGVIVDITERKRLEADLKDRQQQLEESNERLEQFAYAASHDLQEPLRMVTSYLQLIERRYADDLDEEGLEFLEFAVNGANRMHNMINALLEYSRVETQGDSFEPVELSSIVSSVRQDLSLRIDESKAEITIKSLPRVRGDPDQLRQVFQNLLSNAIEYSGDEPPRIRLEAEREGEMWRITVTDQGIGIDPSNQDQVFEIFERLHTHDEQSGTGVGLALCQRIIECHGGTIQVDSDVGEGASFSFTLPADVDGE